MFTRDEAEVLELLLEDDYGLWEVAWRLAGLHNDESGAERAAVTVERRCRRGLATVYVREWIDSEAVPIARSGRKLDLRDPACWNERDTDDAELLLVSTPQGSQRVRTNASGDIVPKR